MRKRSIRHSMGPSQPHAIFGGVGVCRQFVTGYFAFFGVALAIFDALILMSLLP